MPVIARIQQCSGTHTDSTIFSTRPDSFKILARIPAFAGTRPDSTVFRYSHCFYHFSVLVRTVFRHPHGFCNVPVHTLILPFFPHWSEQFFGTRTDSTFFPVLARIQQFSDTHTDSTIFSTRPDSFKVLARIPPFAGTRPDSTFFRYSH